MVEEPTATAAAGEGWRRTLLPLLALAPIAALYAPVVGYGYLKWDDPIYVLLRAPLWAIDSGRAGGWLELLSPSQALGGRFWEYYPLRDLSYGIEVAVAGFSPKLMHLTNLLLHLVATVAVHGLGRKLGLARGRALFAALIFCLHPVAVEPVAWISGRKDLLYTTLTLAALLALPLRGCAKWVGVRTFVAALLALGACTSKGPGVVAVPLLAGLYWIKGERSRRGPLVAIGLVAAFALPWVLFSLHIGRVNGVITVASPGGGWGAAWSALGAPLAAAYRLLVPLDLCPAKVPPVGSVWAQPAPWLVLALTLLALLCRRRRPGSGVASAPILCASAFVLAVVPTSGLVAVAQMGAERFLYLPLAFGALALAALTERLFRPRAHGAVAAPWMRHQQLLIRLSALVLLASMALLSHAYLAAWRDDASLWKYVLAGDRQNPVANGELGALAIEQGHFPLALRLLRRSLKRAPYHATTWSNLGLLQLHWSELAALQPSARAEHRREAAMAFERALVLDPQRSLAHYGLGRLALVGGALARAEQHLRKAAESPRGSLAAVRELARLLEGSGRRAAARRLVHEHLSRFPRDAAAMVGR